MLEIENLVRLSVSAVSQRHFTLKNQNYFLETKLKSRKRLKWCLFLDHKFQPLFSYATGYICSNFRFGQGRSRWLAYFSRFSGKEVYVAKVCRKFALYHK